MVKLEEESDAHNLIISALVFAAIAPALRHGSREISYSRNDCHSGLDPTKRTLSDAAVRTEPPSKSSA